MRKRSDQGGRRVSRKGVIPPPRFSCHQVFGNWYIDDSQDAECGGIVAMTPKEDIAMLLVAAANDFTARMALGAADLSALLKKTKRQAIAAARKRPK
jgi:hypothetical protein